jgi:hypothetical protein
LLLLDRPSAAVEEALSLDLRFAKQVVHRLMRRDSSLESHANSAKKQVWLQLAIHVIAMDDGLRGMGRAIGLVRESGGMLTIDDLLPHLPNFTEIDLFKDEICMTLEVCGSKILSLKEDMEFLSEAADSTLKELEGMESRPYMLSSPHQRCECCAQPLLSPETQAEQFYLFPCQHGFHSRCLLERAPLQLDPDQLRVVRGLQELLQSSPAESAILAAVATAKKAGVRADADHRARARLEAIQTELDGYIAADCPLCGYAMIRLVGCSLIREEEEEKGGEAKAWEL